MRASAAAALALLLPLSSASASTSTPAAEDEGYSESLEHTMLPDSKVLSRFTFNLSSTLDTIYGHTWSDSVSTYASHGFPRAVAAVIRTYNVGEIHLSLTSGRWDYSRWDAPEAHGATPAPPGAELRAWLQDPHQWTPLTHSLSGLFCASLSGISSQQAIEPQLSFPPASSQHVLAQHHYDHQRHALLPLERPCTENLTPFISLLPCRNFAGLASLLDPHFLFDANYQHLGVHVTTDEQDRILLQLEVQVVSDPVRMERKRGGKGRRDWSTAGLFGRPLQRLCPRSEKTTVSARLDEEQASTTTFKPTLDSWTRSNQLDHGLSASKVLGEQDMPFQLSTEWQKEAFFTHPREYTKAPVSISRLLLGNGQERGSIGVSISNTSPEPVTAVWLEEWPWWIKLYLHTLQQHIGHDNPTDVINSLQYRPAVDRHSVTTIEAQLALPPNSTVSLQMDYDKAYLRYTEYPADAHRGFPIPPAVLSYADDQRRAYSSSALMMAPLPDFSMPYNVIVLTCTVLALAFGTVYNMSLRMFVAVETGGQGEVVPIEKKTP